VKRAALAVFLFICVFVLTTPCFSLEAWEKKEIKTVRGEIRSINWVAGYIVVRWFNGNRFDEITVKVPEKFIINKNNNDISLADLNQGDKVAVQYYDDYFGDLTVTNIDVAGL
jgi:hypothetical protein